MQVISPRSLKAWCRTFKEKKQIYGEPNRIMPGGRTPGVDSETAKKMVRKDTDIEPVFFFTLPCKFYEDLLRCLAARTVTALTLGDGAIALAAMQLNKPFIGVALTEEHATGVKLHLANTVFTGYYTEGSPFYNARIATELADVGLAHAAAAATRDKQVTPVAKTGMTSTTPAAPTQATKKAAKRAAAPQPATEEQVAEVNRRLKKARAENQKAAAKGDTRKKLKVDTKAQKAMMQEALAAIGNGGRDEIDVDDDDMDDEDAADPAEE